MHISESGFFEPDLCSVNSPHRDTVILSKDHSLKLLLWNLKWDIWKRTEAYGEKENILR